MYRRVRVSVLVFFQIDTSLVQTPYSSAITVNSSMYLSIDCMPSMNYYQAIELRVIETGYYSFAINGSTDISSIVAYKDNFNPFNPQHNRYANYYRECSGDRFRMVVYLQGNSVNVIVVETSFLTAAAAFSIFVFGPNNVNLSRSGKYLYCYKVLSKT